MPVQPIGKVNKKGAYGSPYSISDYYKVNPDFGTVADFKRLVDSVHAKGMYLIIDEVANHTAWDNGWIYTNPDWYTHDSAGKIIPPNPDWTDVADLNYDNSQLRAEMIKSMKYWIDSFNIDGYRCDAASMVPDDFWKSCIDTLRKMRPLLMLAESDDPKMYKDGFDITYGWNMYHDLIHIWKGDSLTSSLFRILASDEVNYPAEYHAIRFITDHDENSWDDVPQVKFLNEDGAKAAFVTMVTLPGVPFIYQGQEVGYPQKINLFEKYNIDWNENPEVRSFYTTMLTLYDSSEILQNGRLEKINSGSEDVLMFNRILEHDSMTVMVNVRNHPVNIVLPGVLAGKSYCSVLKNKAVKHSKSFQLGPYEYEILQFQ